MDMVKVGRLFTFYNEFLLNNCIPFWLKNSLDLKHGGYLTCLDRYGNVNNTNKAVWFQGRGTWMYSRLYNCVEKKTELLEAAGSGYEFLKKYCFDSDGRAFLEVTQDGLPVRKAPDIFSEAFAVIAFAEYYRASGDQEAKKLALQTFDRILDAICGKAEAANGKSAPDAKFKRLAVPMILLSVIQVLREAVCSTEFDDTARWLSDRIFRDFADDTGSVFVEFSEEKTEHQGDPRKCHIKPGHSIEAAWFVIHEGIYRKDDKLIRNALKVLGGSLERGWDKEYGGIIYHTDEQGKKGEDGDWHLKLWWPQTEAIYASLLAFDITGDPEYENWFDKIHEWSFAKFSDKEFGEWYSDLYRDGAVRNACKGSLWKGPFHLPRALLLCLDILGRRKGREK